MIMLFASIIQLHFIYFFFFNDTATTEIYTLSLHDALPISHAIRRDGRTHGAGPDHRRRGPRFRRVARSRLVALGWCRRRLVFGPEQPLLGGRGPARSHHERASDRPVRPRDGVSPAQARPLLHTGPLQCDRRSRSVPVAAERLGTANGWRRWVTASTSVWHAPSSAPNRMARRCLAVARLGREQRGRARRIDHE